MRIDIRRAREIGQQVEAGSYTGDYTSYQLAWGRLYHSPAGTRSKPNPNHMDDHRLARIMWDKVGELFPAKVAERAPVKSLAVQSVEGAMKVIAALSTTEIIAMVNELDVDWAAFSRAATNLENAKACSNPLVKQEV